jgi:hypothetical protein
MEKWGDIKKQYDKMSITEIEGSLTKGQDAMLEMIRAFWYLHHTGRYKENKKYAKCSFEAYLWDFGHMPLDTYYQRKASLIENPEECKSLGIGMVTKIRKHTTDPGKCLTEIKKRQTTRKTVLPRERVEEVYRQHYHHPKPKPVLAPKPESETIAQLKSLEQERLDDKNQIAKLKASVTKYKTLYEEYKQKYEAVMRALNVMVEQNGGEEKIQMQL